MPQTDDTDADPFGGPIDMEDIQQRHRISRRTLVDVLSEMRHDDEEDLLADDAAIDLLEIQNRHRASTLANVVEQMMLLHDDDTEVPIDMADIQRRHHTSTLAAIRSEIHRGGEHRFSTDSLRFFGDPSTPEQTPAMFWDEFSRRESSSSIDISTALEHPEIQREQASAKYNKGGESLHHEFRDALSALVTKTGMDADLKLEAAAILRTSERLGDTAVPTKLRQHLALRVASTTLSWVWGAVKGVIHSDAGTFLIDTSVHLAAASTVTSMFGADLPIVGQIAGTLAVQGVNQIKTALQTPQAWTAKKVFQSVTQATFAVVGNVATGMLTKHMPGGPVVQQFLGVAIGNTIQATGGSALQTFEGILFGKATVANGTSTIPTVDRLLQGTRQQQPVSATEELALLSTHRPSILMGIKVAAVASAATMMILGGHGAKVARIGWKFAKENKGAQTVAVSAAAHVLNVSMKELVEKASTLSDYLLAKAGLKDCRIVHKKLRDRLQSTIFHSLVERLTISGLVRSSLSITGQIGSGLGAKYAVDKAFSYDSIASAHADFNRMYDTAQTTVGERLRVGKGMLHPSSWFAAIDRAYKAPVPLSPSTPPPTIADFQTMMQRRLDAEEQKSQDRRRFTNAMETSPLAPSPPPRERSRSFQTLMQHRMDAEQQQAQDRRRFTNAMETSPLAAAPPKALAPNGFLSTMPAPFDVLLFDLEAFQDAGYAEHDKTLTIGTVNAFNAYLPSIGLPPTNKQRLDNPNMIRSMGSPLSPPGVFPPPDKPTPAPDPLTQGLLYQAIKMLPLPVPLPSTAAKITNAAKLVTQGTKILSYASLGSSYEQPIGTIDRILSYVPDIWDVASKATHLIVPTKLMEEVDRSTSFNPIWEGFVWQGLHPTTHWTNGLHKIAFGGGVVDYMDSMLTATI